MNPTTVLADIRQCLEVADDESVTLASRNLHRERACELIAALDDRLTQGGALPEQWRANRDV
jgi:hypothetical protein